MTKRNSALLILATLVCASNASASNFSQFFSGGSANTYYKKVFTASGTWTHPNPGNAMTVQVTAIGGGAGHCAVDGGSSSFGSLITATGGLRGGTSGLGNGGNRGTCMSTSKSNNSSLSLTGSGGPAILGFGAGGARHEDYAYNDTGFKYTCGGGSGYVASGTFSVTANQTVTVGAGGACTGVGVGGDGAVIVEWWQ